MTTLEVRVAAKQVQAEGICSFDLVPAQATGTLPAFTPGAHIDVHLPNGLVRQYSLWNHPGQANIYRIGVLKEAAGRGGSQAMHESIHVGDTLRVGTPRNQFELSTQPGKSLLLAGGIGITPIFCMAQELAARKAPFDLHYCSRSRSRTAFLEQLQHPELREYVQLHVDDEDPAQRLDIAGTLRQQPAGTHLYVCGPKGFMDAVLNGARAQGWDESRLHYEFFQGEVKASAGDTAFDVRLARSNFTIHVEADQTVTQALEANGVRVQTSCEQGICGTCVITVLEGTPDHRDSYLMPEEQAANNCFTPCCSRAKSAVLVLDL